MPSLYEISVPIFIHSLQVLSHLLTKAESFAKEKGIPESDITSARLAPDMLPLTFQINTCSNSAKNALVRVAGTTAVPMEDKKEATFAELQDRIAKTIDLLKESDAKAFEGKEDEEVVMKFSSGERKFTGQSYLTTFAIPNFYFHMSTTYAILRMKGVPLGKQDFLTGSQQ